MNAKKRYFIPLVFIFLITFSQVLAQKMDCQKFRNGVFKMIATDGKTFYYFNRVGDRQTEVEKNRWDTAVFIVKWIDDCTYTLTPSEETLKRKIVSDNITVIVKITEVRDSSYLAMASFGNADDIVQVSEVIKVSDVPTEKKTSPQKGLFPKYTEAVEHFFDVTELGQLEDPEITFQKKAAGWFAEVTSQHHDTLIENNDTIIGGRDTLLIKIWDSSTGQYSDTTLQQDTTREVFELRKHYVEHWEKIHFDACPYFGYKGWQDDVLARYAEYNGNDAETVYGIARAYSAHADYLLSERTPRADTSKMFLFKNINDKLSAEQLAEYRKYRYKAIELYKKVAALNPSYQTVIGRIELKPDFERVLCYLDLLQYSTKEEAARELPDGLFTPFHREFAYNLLMSCDKDAILFVDGDLDTYIPIYFQQKEGIRKDVTIVNAVMLGFPRYCNYLEKEYGLKFTLRDAKNPNELDGVFLQKDGEDDWMDNNVLSYLNDTTNRRKYSGYSYTTLPVSRFLISYRKGVVKYVRWNSDSEYLYKFQVLVADLICSNKKRPVYFANTCDQDVYEGYNENLLAQILTYKLTDEYNTKRSMYENIDMEKSFQLASAKFKWEHATKAVSHEKRITHTYVTYLARLARELAENKRAQEAGKIIDLYLKNFSNEQLAFDHYTLPLVEACYTLEKFDLGNQIAKKIVYNYMHDIRPLDANLVNQYKGKYTRTISDVREVMNRFSQDTSILDAN